ncbi:MAG: hypothetical protein JOZ47_19300 [Kutzneria sp.]|nr:hypothetical protein [Kutzneria sp.]MBV9847191.1 hypothetical protein [Kutzneria sp.]
MKRWWRRLIGVGDLPAEFAGTLDREEKVLAACGSGSGAVMATSMGLWLPDSSRVGWHLISKATWGDGVLTVVVAQETGTAGDAVLLSDQPPRRVRLERPGRLPEVVRRRVTGSIRSSHRHELPGGVAWFVQRRVAGQDGIVLQVRADPGVDPDVVAAIASRVSDRLPRHHTDR